MLPSCHLEQCPQLALLGRTLVFTENVNDYWATALWHHGCPVLLGGKASLRLFLKIKIFLRR
jgi:hypothetical protein